MASSGTGQCSSFTSWLDMGTIADPMQYASDRIPTPSSASFFPRAPGTICAKSGGYTRSTAIPNHRKASTPTTVVSNASLKTSILCGPLLSHRPRKLAPECEDRRPTGELQGQNAFRSSSCICRNGLIRSCEQEPLSLVVRQCLTSFHLSIFSCHTYVGRTTPTPSFAFCAFWMIPSPSPPPRKCLLPISRKILRNGFGMQPC